MIIAGIALCLMFLSVNLLLEENSRKANLKRETEILSQYESWMDSKLDILLSDSRLSDILSIMDQTDDLKSTLKTIHADQDGMLKMIGNSLSTMLSAIFDLMDYQMDLISDRDYSTDFSLSHVSIYKMTQKLFMEIISVNLQIITSRFIYSDTTPEDILHSIEVITSQSTLLQESLMTSEEEKIFDRYRLNEMKWRTNIENLLNNDDRKRELTNAIHFSLGEISNHTYLPSIIMISILLSLLLFILAIVLFTISQKQRKTNLLSITEMIQLKQINASLEEENYQLKIQLTEKDTDLIKINRIIEKKNIEAEEGRARLSTLETEIRDLQAINDQLKSEIEVVAKQKILNTSTDDIDTFIKAFDFISDSLTSFIREYHELFSNTELFSEVQQIDQLISYLEDLFGETRLLSLNAAVESARAGESGKGFGIVADKIREISEKSQNLSKDLKKILRLLTRRLEHETQNKRDNMSKLTAELEELTDYSQEMIKTINTIKNKNHPS